MFNFPRSFALSRSVDAPGTMPLATRGAGEPTRRQFLYGSGVGALTVAAVGVGTSSVHDDVQVPRASAAVLPTVPDASSEPIIAVLRDVGAGEFAVLSGEREVIVVDKTLAACFARAVAADAGRV